MHFDMSPATPPFVSQGALDRMGTNFGTLRNVESYSDLPEFLGLLPVVGEPNACLDSNASSLFVFAPTCRLHSNDKSLRLTPN